jgi:hypothetical protein
MKIKDFQEIVKALFPEAEKAENFTDDDSDSYGYSCIVNMKHPITIQLNLLTELWSVAQKVDRENYIGIAATLQTAWELIMNRRLRPTIALDRNIWHLVTKPSDDGTLGIGNIFKVDDQGFLHCKRAGTLLPDEAFDALEGVEFIKVADIDMEALAAVGALVNHFGKMSHANRYTMEKNS